MAEIKITINGKSYGVACDDGQEERVRSLATYVDERLREIAGAGAAVGDAHLLVLASVVLADEIFDLREYCENLVTNANNADRTGNHNPSERISAQEEELIVRAIESLTNRINYISGDERNTHT